MSGWWQNRSESVSVLLMSIATLLTAWCAAQAEAWSGTQLFRMSASNQLFGKAVEAQIEGNQIRMFDASQFTIYATARASHDEPLAVFLHDRLRPDMRRAVDAWWATRPLENASAPASPLLMAEYVVPQYETSTNRTKAGEACRRDARIANDVSDEYTLTTVILALVVLLGGMAPKLVSPQLRWTLLAASGLLLVVCGTWVGTRPIAALETRRDRLLSAMCEDALSDAHVSE